MMYMNLRRRLNLGQSIQQLTVRRVLAYPCHTALLPSAAQAEEL